MRHMKALVLTKGKLRLRDVPKPVPSMGEALIKVIKAGICNTDLELVLGYMSFEGVLGHEAENTPSLLYWEAWTQAWSPKR